MKDIKQTRISSLFFFIVVNLALNVLNEESLILPSSVLPSHILPSNILPSHILPRYCDCHIL